MAGEFPWWVPISSQHFEELLDMSFIFSLNKYSIFIHFHITLPKTNHRSWKWPLGRGYSIPFSKSAFSGSMLVFQGVSVHLFVVPFQLSPRYWIHLHRTLFETYVHYVERSGRCSFCSLSCESAFLFIWLGQARWSWWIGTDTSRRLLYFLFWLFACRFGVSFFIVSLFLW